ncbi:MAG: hypothetical protein F6J94_18060 [Moorea sp. SIO1F2]|uniref:hypothetical protein n=1 Tax=unclassified Moorena TaxID=2683338 RepID=UPI0013BE5F3E|nr:MULTISPECIES: hypothetical protein [unclassified Moorena]NEN94669.1 hypothetical protein [Moorena sp. SIO3I7]NEO08829.1 hypothetical protein [Moorena sp. SIO3I8]NEO18295.1 hypothetical protein [Moorena sp. SIO4A5]NEP24265.1 hypothetical protein [Moorena sp. SIO3I6]NEQ57386.1 hypothetical protein [Moorena sp. SIO4A1]
MTSQETGASSYASSALGQGVYGEVKLVKLRYSQRDDFSEASPKGQGKGLGVIGIPFTFVHQASVSFPVSM